MTKLYLALDVDFDDDDKIARLARYPRQGDARALRDLVVAMWRYCKRERSDGHVPVEILGKLVYPDAPKFGVRDADRLVEIGLVEHTDTGYYFPSYLKRNKSRAQLEAEAETKAKAGRLGGKASGETRKSQAEMKHLASHDEAARFDPPKPETETETETHTETSEVQFSGDRPETLRPAAATQPPPTSEPIPASEARCSAHLGVADPGPCRGCRAARENAERRGDRAIDEARRDAERRARECTACDGVHVTGPDQKPTRKICDHRRTA